MNNNQIAQIISEYIFIIVIVYFIVIYLEIFLANQLKDSIFSFGFVYYKDKKEFVIKNCFKNNILNKTNNYKFKFINSQKCIFTRKYSFSEQNKYFCPIKGIMEFKNNQIYIYSRSPLYIILSPILFVFIAFYFGYNERNNIISSAIFVGLSVILMSIFVIIGYHKTKKYVADGVDELISFFNLNNL